MCGIVAAIAQRPIADIVLTGLKALEYRGYDSAGVCFCQDGITTTVKSTGKVAALEQLVKERAANGLSGIAHTRWATHGKPTVANAHPHASGNINLVHNGIVENYQVLKAELLHAGFTFKSETDTEVLSVLIDHVQKQFKASLGEGQTLSRTDRMNALNRALSQVKGSYAIALIDTEDPDAIYVARQGSPLVLGCGIGENFVASDVLALLPVTSRFCYLEDGDRGFVTREGFELQDSNGNHVERTVRSIQVSAELLGKGHYKHYMQKEIFEQPEALKNTMLGRLTKDNVSADAFISYADEGASDLVTTGGPVETGFDAVSAGHAESTGHTGSAVTAERPDFLKCLADIDHVEMAACGTSYHAALVGKYFLEEYAGISTNVTIASEYRYKRTIVPPRSLFVTLSQSGETADTLAAVRLAHTQGYSHVLCICNVANSSLVRESEFAFLTRAGREIGVASTKAFTTQLLALSMLALAIGRAHGTIDSESGASFVTSLEALPARICDVLNLDFRIEELAPEFAGKEHALFLGRGPMYPIALEGALKLKEISYIHAEGYASGELKHGPIALIDSRMPVIVVAPDNQWLPKLISNIEEVRARGGRLYVFAGKNFSSDQCSTVDLGAVSPFIAPIIFTIPLQLLAYHVAVINGTDVDQPRNLAKSVTVE